MKILVISNMYPSDESPNYGVFVKNFCNMLNVQGIHNDKVVLTKQNGYLNKLIGYVKYFFSALRRTKSYNPDIVYIHYGAHNAIIAIFLKLFTKRRVFINLHGSDVVPENKIHKALQPLVRVALKKCDNIVVPSEYFKDIVSNEFSISSKKIEVFPSAGVNNNVFYIKSEEENIELLKKLNLEKETSLIGFVSRIDYGKGWDIFLNAISILSKDSEFIKDKKFIFIGDGKEKEKFYDLMEKHDLNKYIIHKPLVTQKDLNDYYNIMDLFVFPTMRKGESLGLVAIEAMTCRVPVIASDMAAPKYYVKDNYNGFKFQPGSAEELAKKIKFWYGLNDDEKEKIKNNARSFSNEFSTSVISENLCKILNQA